MGLGLLLRADVGDRREPLSSIEERLRSRWNELIERAEASADRLAICLHPAAENVEFSLMGPVVTVDAKTSTVGPGYHAFVCDLLHDLADNFGWKWEAAGDDETGDETDYFTSRDRRALEGEMLAWLRGLCGVLKERADEGATGFAVSLPIGPQYEFDGVAATPMGPRDEAWLDAVIEDPRSGIDMFPWWEAGLGAQHAVGRAVARMWTEVRWRVPVSTAERTLLERIDADLRRAHVLDSGLAMPWPEWAEISRWLERNDDIARAVITQAAATPACIGYRRRWLRTSLPGGWSMRIPGAMSEEVDAEGTWSAHEPGRTIWMSAFRMGTPESRRLTAVETLPTSVPKGEIIDAPDMPNGYAHRTTTSPGGEGSELQVTVELAVPHRLCVLTLVLDDARDLARALDIAGSVRHRDADGS